MHSNAAYRGRANILKRPNRLNVRSGSVAGPPPTHHENIHFYGTHSVDVAGELAKLGSDGYRPLRTAAAAEAL